MIRYNVRSRYLVDVVNDIKGEALVLAPYFQRKLVWRLAHKVDFIKTILLGYPFPEIFISRGSIDLHTMRSTSCLVDGQQRMTTIKEYLDDKFPVEGKKFSALSPQDKADFLKYEIAIIDLDLEQNDTKIIDIFQRLNRTFYALSTIEKLATEFGSSDFMLTAKLLAGELKNDPASDEVIDLDRHDYDPNITKAFTEWAAQQKVGSYIKFLLETSIFTKYEISRQVHLMFTLNVMATILDGYYNRNDSAVAYLETKAETSPDERGELISKIECAAAFFNRLRLRSDSYWYTKSNAFTLLITLCENAGRLENVDVAALKAALVGFGENPPDDYALAAKEGVNNKKERVIRAEHVRKIFAPFLPQ
jgi:hypothetical protein